jgi:hypothetical protein
MVAIFASALSRVSAVTLTGCAKLAKETRESIPAAASNFTFFMVFVLLTFMVESVFAFDGLIISLLTITRVAKSAI